ncbi:MAG TPA: O-antigen ligase family protein [Terriglobales bacterium]
MHPAVGFRLSGCAESTTQPDARVLARRLCQAMVLLPLFSLMLLPEYVQGLGNPEAKSILYRGTLGPLRMVDALLLGIIAAHAIVWLSSRKTRLHLPRPMAVPGFGFLAAIAMAMIYGWLHGGTNLFFDWRALALGIGMYGVFAMWVQTPPAARSAVYLFAGYMALRIGLIYASFLRGEGDVILGVRIPMFDGPTLSAIVFTAVLASSMGDCARGRWRQLLWMSLSAAAYLLVLLCFRRTFWAELGVATGLLLLLRRNHRRRKLLLAMMAVAAVALTLGPAFYQRMQSLDFTNGESEFSQGNPDHVGDVLDAWDQVRQHPFLGIGLGRSYPTLRIQEWKEESVMVHNAPLHVWLKYGLIGLACYVWFHFAIFGWLFRRHRAAGLSEEQVWLAAALVYLAAQFAVSLGFTPWPYSSVQSTLLIAFVLAVSITGATPCNFQQFPSSLPR